MSLPNETLNGSSACAQVTLNLRSDGFIKLNSVHQVNEV